MKELFWKTISDYNQATWIYQILICIVGLILTLLLYKKPGKTVKLLMKGYLAFCFGWIAIVFFFTFGTEEIGKMKTTVLFAVISILWIVDIFINKVTFERETRYNKLTYLFYALFACYPLFSILFGNSFPSLVVWLMPCPLTTFALTLLAAFSKKTNYALLVLLILWGLTGIPKIFIFDVPEDFILGLAGFMGIAVAWLQGKERRRMKSKA